MKSQDGSVLVLSLILIIALLGLVAAMVYSIRGDLSISRHEFNSTQAHYYAESAVEYASRWLEDDTQWTSNQLHTDRQDDLVDELPGLEVVSITRNNPGGGDIYNIESRVRFNRNNERTEDRVRVTYEVQYSILDDSLFEHPLAAGGHLQPNADVRVEGDVAANGKVNNQRHILNNPADLIRQFLAGTAEELPINELMNYLDAAASSATDIITDWATFSNDNTVNGATELDIDGKIVVIKDNITMNQDLHINGSGILIVEQNLNQNGNSKLFANYDPNTNSYTDDYAITYFGQAGGNPNPRCGNYKGMLMGKNDLNVISNAANPFEIVGSAFAGNNLNTNNGTFIEDDGYVDVMIDLAIEFNFWQVDRDVYINSWQEFFN